MWIRRQFVDRISVPSSEAMCALMGLSNDQFIRTTEPRHSAACQALWTAAGRRGEIYLGQYEGWYAVRDEAFYDEDELRRFGRAGAEVAPASGAPVEWVVEPSLLLPPLGNGRTGCWRLRRSDPEHHHPGRLRKRNEVHELRAIGGLTRPVREPDQLQLGRAGAGDPAHVMYVWLDALTNYITAAGLSRRGGAAVAVLAGGSA